jgi:hypothetical protein
LYASLSPFPVIYGAARTAITYLGPFLWYDIEKVVLAVALDDDFVISGD